MKKNIYIVDVFTDQPLSGNPLAVVVCEQELPESDMQKVAAEMNFSETTFVLPRLQSNGGYNIRIYTPSREIEFAGHPLLGTAQVIREYVSCDKCEVIKLNLLRSQILVTFEVDEEGKQVAWFEAPEISLGNTIAVEPIAHALNILPEDIDSKLPIQVCSAGTSAIIVPLRSLDALHRCKLDLEKFSPLVDEGFPPLIYLFTQQTHDNKNNFCVRFFFDAYGVREDPATGNGAAFFGSYLLEHNYFPEPMQQLRIEQGHEVRRPSLIMLRAEKQGDIKKISVGGHTAMTVIGELV